MIGNYSNKQVYLTVFPKKLWINHWKPILFDLTLFLENTQMGFEILINFEFTSESFCLKNTGKAWLKLGLSVCAMLAMKDMGLINALQMVSDGLKV